VLEAAFWGFVGGAALLLGAIVGIRAPTSQRTIGLVMAFGAGVLISALAFEQAFAAGAILTMLADTMMPESFEHGGNVVGLVTPAGFALAFLLSTAE
jgi:zinc transporter ZupT